MFGGFPFEFFERGGGGFPGMGGRQERESAKNIDTTHYYEILGVEKTASTQDILKAYRQLARTMHPDKGGDPKVFAELTQAKEILTDPEKRKVYDVHGEEGINKGMSSHDEGMSIFDLINGGGRKRDEPKRCQDTTHTIKVTLEEIYHGTSKKLAITRSRNCVDCNGLGGSKVEICTECRGRGMVKKLVQIGPGMYSQSAGPCDECRGGGKSIDPKFRCKTCKGARSTTEKKVIEVVVDKGTPNHHKQNFHAEGDEEPGLSAGDVVIVIEEKEHPLFKRKKSDLIMTKSISLKEALTGYRFVINHLDGEKIIESAPGEIIKPGEIRTVEELGMPLMRTPFKFGNLFISFEVEFPAPKTLTKAAIKEIETFLPGTKQNPEGKGLKALIFDKTHITENHTDIHSDYQEDQDDEPGEGRRVQCSGSIF